MASLATNALTTVSDVKESLGIQSGDLSWDNLIIRKINQVSSAIESYCQRSFLLTNYLQEEYKASGIDELVLRQSPITIDGTHTFLAEWRTTTFNMGPAADTWETIDSQLYFVDESSGVINLLFNALGYWNRYRFSYWAGYSSIPNDLAEAANMIACWFVQNPDGHNVYIMQRAEGSRSTRLAPAGTKSFYALLQDLGVDEIVDSYSSLPLLTDR